MRLRNLTLLAAAFMLAACGGEKKAPDEDVVDEVVSDTVASAPSMTTVAVNHAVSDFAAWHAMYKEKSNVDARVGVLQSVDDPNMVHVAEMTESHESAMARMGSEEFKAMMADAGIVGEPEVSYLNMKYMNKEAAELKPGDYVAAIKHQVSDYAVWREKFDADNDNRLAAGLVCRGLGTIEGNDNMVFIVLGVADLEKCKGMLSDPKMMEVMREAGVMGEPEVSYWVVPTT